MVKSCEFFLNGDQIKWFCKTEIAYHSSPTSMQEHLKSIPGYPTSKQRDGSTSIWTIIVIFCSIRICLSVPYFAINTAAFIQHSVLHKLHWVWGCEMRGLNILSANGYKIFNAVVGHLKYLIDYSHLDKTHLFNNVQNFTVPFRMGTGTASKDANRECLQHDLCLKHVSKYGNNYRIWRHNWCDQSIKGCLLYMSSSFLSSGRSIVMCRRQYGSESFPEVGSSVTAVSDT